MNNGALPCSRCGQPHGTKVACPKLVSDGRRRLQRINRRYRLSFLTDRQVLRQEYPEGWIQ